MFLKEEIRKAAEDYKEDLIEAVVKMSSLGCRNG